MTAETQPEQDLGRVAYEAYWRGVRGPEAWAAAGELHRADWQAAAEAVKDAVLNSRAGRVQMCMDPTHMAVGQELQSACRHLWEFIGRLGASEMVLLCRDCAEVQVKALPNGRMW